MLLRSFVPITAFIAAAIAAPTLLLEVSGPPIVNSIDRLNITTTVRNVGDEAVKLLNHPRSPLSDLPTDMFAITNRHGLSPDFVGIGVKYSPSAAAASNDYHAYTVLAPGQSVSVDHDISGAYDFSASGPGQYVVRMKSTRMFYYVVDGKVVTLAGGRSEPFHTVTIVGDARSHESPSHNPSSEQCEAWETHAINAAIPLAKKYVRRAVEALKKGGPQDGEYMRWFGPGLYGNRYSVVSGRFEALVDNNFAGYTYTCRARFCANHPGVFGYAYTNKFGAIHLCNQVFEAEIGGQDSRASTIVHQALVFEKNAGGVVDHIHGSALALELAESHPHLAATNADNYEYFAVAAAGDGGDNGSVLLTEVYFGKHISDL